MMIHLRHLVTAALLAALALPGRAAVNLAEIIGDQTPGIIALHDFPGLLKNWRQSPWAKTWNDPQMVRFLAPLRAKMELDRWDEVTRRETGHTVDELLGLATGQALLTLTNLDFATREGPARDVPLLFVIEFGPNAPTAEKILNELIAKDPKDKDRVTTEDFAGITVYRRPLSDKSGEEDEVLAWAFAEGFGLMSTSKHTLLATLDALKKGGADNALARSEPYLRARQLTGDAQALAYINFKAITPVVKYTLAAKTSDAAAAGNPPKFDPVALIDALGLDALDTLTLGMTLGDTATAMSGGLTYTEERGLIKLLAYRDGPCERPAFVSEKWVTAASGRFSFRDAYAALEEILETFNPLLAGMVQGQIKQLNQRLNIDLRRDLVGSLGDSVLSAQAVPAGGLAARPGQPAAFDQLIALSLENVPAFNATLDALKSLLGPEPETFIKQRPYLGSVINTFAPPGSDAAARSPGVSWATTSRYLFLSIGSPAMIETALQGLGGQQPSLWDKPEVKPLLAEFPPDASTIQIQNTGTIMGAALDIMVASFTAAFQAAPKTEGEPAEPPFDLSAKPDAETIGKYWGYASGYGTRDNRGFYFRSKLNYAK